MARTSTGTPVLSRREMLRLAAAGYSATSMSGWLGSLAADTPPTPSGNGHAFCCG